MADRPPIAVLDAPSNLGLRMPASGVVPGCYKMAGALRDQRLVARLGAEEAGHMVAPRYDVSGWKTGDGIFNAEGVAAYSRRLADRVGALVDSARFPVVLGGDCSIVLGPALALRRRGRYGVVYVDGHGDFRHPGNSAHVGAAAGEGTALITGRGQADIADLDGLTPYVADTDLVIFGVREDDVYLHELTAAGIAVTTAPRIRQEKPGSAAADAADALADLDGFWVHVDVDVLDESVMPAVDSPSRDGLGHAELVDLLTPLLSAHGCIGVDFAIFDPDLDPDGTLASRLADTIAAALVRPPG